MARTTLTVEELREALSVEETARLFHVDPRTIRQWINEGKLGAVKAGRSYVVPQRYVEERATDLSKARHRRAG